MTRVTHCNILSQLQALHGLLNLLVRKNGPKSPNFNRLNLFLQISWSISCFRIISTVFDFIFVISRGSSTLCQSFCGKLLAKPTDGKLPHFSDFVFGWVFARINSLNSILLASLFGLKAQIKQKTPIYDLPNCYFERFYVHFRFKVIENSQNWGLWESVPDWSSSDRCHVIEKYAQ